MIKFLHTADLHLGKIFHEQSLKDDQNAMLDQLAGLLAGDDYSALIIAGDVYDRSIPSPEAVELFGSFLGKVKAGKSSPLEIFIIPGNHDSASRLGFGKELFARLGIRFGVSAADCDKPVILERGGESCAFFLLPFLNPGVLESENPEGNEPLRSQSALAEEAERRMAKARQDLRLKGVARSVLVAHLFATGSTEAGSERVFLGNAENVRADVFRDFDYVALGHLHRAQRAGEKAWYPGSPLAYSFAEAGQEKYFLSVEISDNGAVVEKIPVAPLRGVTSLTGPFDRFEGDIKDDPELLASANNYLEIRLTDRGITENARDILRKRFPYLLSLRQDEALSNLAAGSSMRRGIDTSVRRSITDDFKNFLLDLYGKDDPEETELFNNLLAEAEAGEISS